MRVTKMAAPLGAVIEDIDVRTVGEDEAATLNQLFGEHHVLVFPKQQLTPDEQVAFAQHWGELVPFPYGSLPGYPNIIELRNRGKKRDVNQHWHSDMTYDPKPPKLTMLYALEAPAIGGQTAFANQIHAYEELSTGMKSLVDSLVALHSAKDLARLYGQDPDQASEAEHPVVRTHDETGQRSVHLRRYRRFVTGHDDKLLDYLYEHAFAQIPNTAPVAGGRLRMGQMPASYAVHDHGDVRV